jgi:hypothetical protein
MATASGSFANAGDAQTSLYVMRRTTTDAAWHSLYLDGSSAPLTIAVSRTVTFDILVVGRSTGGESAGYQILGVIENVGGSVSVWATTAPLHYDDGAWDARVVAGLGPEQMVVEVIGNGETIRWVAVVRTAEVSW